MTSVASAENGPIITLLIPIIIQCIIILHTIGEWLPVYVARKLPKVDGAIQAINAVRHT